MAAHALMTAEQFDQLPAEEGRQWELLDGELIQVSSATLRHNKIVARLQLSLGLFLRSTRLGEEIPGTEFAVGANRRLRPDIAVLSREKFAQADPDKVPLEVMPDIAVEVVSPSESAADLDRKVEAYLEAGVAEVWVVYPESRHLLALSRAACRNLHASEILESPLLPGWSLPLEELFESF